MVGVILMFCSAAGLLGLLRKSWTVRENQPPALWLSMTSLFRPQILALLVVVLVAVLFALFAIMIVCFVLGYQMPSLRDIVADTWHEGCATPAVHNDADECLHKNLIVQNWCWDHKGLAIPGMFEAGEKDVLCAVDDTNQGTDLDAQRTHVCQVSCQKAQVALLEDNMSYVSGGCFFSFVVLVLVVLWNSQTHHGLWCLKPSADEDDDENTVMSIPPGMMYVAFLFNGLLGLSGLAIAIFTIAYLDDTTSFAAVLAILIGVCYFLVAAASCACVAKNIHWGLRICNIIYTCSSLPLLFLSLIAAVYSGEIENVRDTYDDNWCKVRGELDAVDPMYCASMSDASCKAKIVDDTTTHMLVVGWIVFITLGAVSALIWFSTRLSRKYRFDAREDFEDGDDGDDKGGDDDDDDGGGGGKDPIQMFLVGAPLLFALIATIVVVSVGGDGLQDSAQCSTKGVTTNFVGLCNSTGAACQLDGYVAFSQPKEANGVVLDVKYNFPAATFPTTAPVTGFEIHEFPVPNSGDCSAVGTTIPSGRYEPTAVEPGTYPNVLAVQVEDHADGTESLYYDGEVPLPETAPGGSHPAVQLFGENAILGQSLVLTGTEACLPTDAADTDTTCTLTAGDQAGCEAQGACTYVSSTPGCATITQVGEEVASANITGAFGDLQGKIQGTVTFRQVAVGGRAQSDATIYVELEATADWNETADGTPTTRGCAADDGDFVSCGHKMHIHLNPLDTAAENVCAPASAGGHFNLAAGNVEACDISADGSDPGCAASCGAANTWNKKMTDCETGDLTGMYGTVSIGKPGTPSKYFWVNRFNAKHGILIAGGDESIRARSIVLHDHSEGPDRKACADIPRVDVISGR